MPKRGVSRARPRRPGRGTRALRRRARAGAGLHRAPRRPVGSDSGSTGNRAGEGSRDPARARLARSGARSGTVLDGSRRSAGLPRDRDAPDGCADPSAAGRRARLGTSIRADGRGGASRLCRIACASGHDHDVLLARAVDAEGEHLLDVGAAARARDDRELRSAAPLRAPRAARRARRARDPPQPPSDGPRAGSNGPSTRPGRRRGRRSQGRRDRRAPSRRSHPGVVGHDPVVHTKAVALQVRGEELDEGRRRHRRLRKRRRASRGSSRPSRPRPRRGRRRRRAAGRAAPSRSRAGTREATTRRATRASSRPARAGRRPSARRGRAAARAGARGAGS